ncbi:unnamed protein product [Zymoseptoria tritici ST99CH_1A5]|nr:unnamed protein product [Zymoseptoria tritici ST99CH_1A5]
MPEIQPSRASIFNLDSVLRSHIMTTALCLRPSVGSITMNGLRTQGQCAARRLSSQRQPVSRRYASSASPSPRPSFLRRHPRVILTTIALGLGVGVGTFAVHLISPPPMPQPGTHEDNILITDLNKRIDEEFKVKVLRGKCLGVAKQLKGEEGGWVEVLPRLHPTHLEGLPENKLPFHDRLTDHLQGARGLGVERIFWDRSEKKLVAIVWFGGAMSGWPGVTHGGLLATALEEKIALAAALSNPSSESSVSAAATPQRLPGTGNHATMTMPLDTPAEPAQVSIDYRKPTYANSFYTIRVTPAFSADDDAGNVRYAIKGAEYQATLETMDAQICVKAAAKFAPRSTAEQVEEKVAEAAKWSLDEFKQWMWPSRQQQIR